MTTAPQSPAQLRSAVLLSVGVSIGAKSNRDISRNPSELTMPLHFCSCAIFSFAWDDIEWMGDPVAESYELCQRE